MTKPTKREQFVRIQAILEGVDEGELATFVAGQVEQLDKRAKAPRKMTVSQRENVAVKQAIYGILGNAEAPMRATDVANAVEISVQKATALLRQLVGEGLVARQADGKVVTFTVAK